MAVTWTLRTEVVNPETDLRKVWATRTDDAGKSQTFFVKGRMKTPEEQKKVSDNLSAQYSALLIIQSQLVDEALNAVVANLAAKEIV